MNLGLADFNHFCPYRPRPAALALLPLPHPRRCRHRPASYPLLPLPPSPLQELVRHEDRIALSSSEAIGPSLGVRLPEEDDDIIFMGSAEEAPGGGGGGGAAGGPRGLAQFLRGSWGPGRGRRPPPVSHVFNTAPIRSLLLQMTESPQIMQNMFSAPYIQVGSSL